MSENNFGSCCSNLKEALDSSKKNSLFRVEVNGVLYLTTGYASLPTGQIGWFDQAAIFCPFCGAKIQDESEINRSSWI